MPSTKRISWSDWKASFVSGAAMVEPKPPTPAPPHTGVTSLKNRPVPGTVAVEPNPVGRCINHTALSDTPKQKKPAGFRRRPASGPGGYQETLQAALAALICFFSHCLAGRVARHTTCGGCPRQSAPWRLPLEHLTEYWEKAVPSAVSLLRSKTMLVGLAAKLPADTVSQGYAGRKLDEIHHGNYLVAFTMDPEEAWMTTRHVIYGLWMIPVLPRKLFYFW